MAKKVQPEYPQSPIWWNTSKTLLIDAPATKTPKLSRISPAGYFPRTVGCDFQEPHSSFWRISFAVETEHCKQLQQHAVEHDELGFIIPRSVRINSAKFKVCLGHLNHMIPYYLL